MLRDDIAQRPETVSCFWMIAERACRQFSRFSVGDSFYANEVNEPPHVHARKAEKECKYWLDRDGYDLEEVFSYLMNARGEKDCV